MFGNYGKMIGMSLAMAGIAFMGMGCPGGPGSVIEIWLVNDSDEFEIISVVITNDSDTSQTEELVSGNIQPNTTRRVLLATVESFTGSTATLDISGLSINTAVQIDEAIVNGGIYPIAIKGDTAITFDSEYLPIVNGS